MAHGRRRSFFAGAAIGMLASFAGILILAQLLEIEVVEPGRPLFPESARNAIIDWARLSPFPKTAKSLQVLTEGGPFTRSFRVTFYGDPESIKNWVSSCPGILDPQCKKEIRPDGSIRYEIPAGGGAAFAEMIHYPDRGTIEIYVYWS